jgi:predicted amidohydrolase YtcJ
MTVDEIHALAARALDAGLGVATHAIGDLAVTRTLDAYQRLLTDRPDLDPKRLRIEHFSYAREADFARAVSLGIVLSIQSNFNALPDEEPTFGAMRVGAKADARVYAWDRLERMGAPLAEGSDYFTRPGDAMANFTAALTRKGSVGASRPDSLGRLVAWRANSIWFTAEGPADDPTLRAGAGANLVILNSDPFSVPRDSLASIRVLATLRAGVPVFVDGSIASLLGPPH